MAIDQALLESVEAGESKPVLRIYNCQPACISIGRDQDWDVVDTDLCEDQGWDIVRRPTSGRAILHTTDLAYALCLPLDEPRARGDEAESYDQLSEGLLQALSLMGLEPDKTRPYYNDDGPPGPVGFDGPADTDFDVSIGQRKLISSGQWRTAQSLLQQGSFPLSGAVAQIADGLLFDYPGQKIAMVLRLGYRATTLELMTGRIVPFEEASAVFSQGFAEALNLTFEEQPLTDKEKARAQELRAEKYASQSWFERV
jgi:lipoate-protein ligase A